MLSTITNNTSQKNDLVMIQIKTLHQRLLMVECTRAQRSHIRSLRDSTPVVRDDECLGKALHVSWYYALCHTSP